MRGKFMLVGMLLAGVIAGAQEITLDEALIMASQGNPDIRIQQLQLERSGLEVSRSKKEYLPEFSANTSYLPTENTDGDDGWGYTTIGARLPLFTGGRRSAQLGRSRVDERVARERLDTISLDIREQVVFKYFDILNTMKNIEVNEGVLETLGKQKDRLQGMFDGGKLIPKSELLKVESDILRSEAEKYTYEQDLEVLKYELKILLGMGQEEEVDVATYHYEGLDLERYRLEGDLEMALATSNRANLEKLKVERAEYGVKIARSEFLPQIDARAAYILDEGYDENLGDDYGVALTASWKIFDWGSNVDNYRQEKMGLEQSRIDSQKGLDQLAVDIRGEYANIMSLNMQTESEEKNLEISRDNLRIDSMRYDTGLIGSFEYLDSVTKLARAESNFVRLQRDLVLATIRYEDLLK